MRSWMQASRASRFAAWTLLAWALASPPAVAQLRPLSQDEGGNGLGLALRRLPVSASVLYVTAHPDDENNGVLVKLRRGLGVRTALLTLTRGEGGQNEIGPELNEAIGILRTEELAAVHRYDGAEQYFSRAYEFGYSFSVEETTRPRPASRWRPFVPRPTPRGFPNRWPRGFGRGRPGRSTRAEWGAATTGARRRPQR
jgi:hypothetical protein